MYTREEQIEINRINESFACCKVKPIYSTVRNHVEMIKMKDEVLLNTIIYKPSIEKKFPTIVVRTCYPQNDFIYRCTASKYAERGFAFVFQYCRGTGGSEGEWVPNVNERKDGIDTLEWICKQEWVGDIGYFGCSYLALTGWVMADVLPEKVKTMYLTHYGTYRHTSAYKDGMFRHDVLTAWAMENAGFNITTDYLETCKYRPHIDVDQALWGRKIEWYRSWISNTNRDDEYWNSGFWGMLQKIPSNVKVPIYIVEGWYDHHLGSAIETYQALPLEIKNRSKLSIGGWDHDFQIKLEDRVGRCYENNDILRAFNWFYQILVEKQESRGEVSYYVIGDDRWVTFHNFDQIEQNYRTFYLNSMQTSTLPLTKSNELMLEESCQKTEEKVSFCYNPQNPVMTHGAESLLYTKEQQGSLRQVEMGERDDVISCISNPITDDITIMGKIEVDLVVATDAEDTAFVVKVIEVLENKKAYNIRTGITTLGYRNNANSRKNYKPHDKVKVTIDMWDICWKLHRGSRLRIDITSSDFPQYSVHTNYAGGWAIQKNIQIAKQTIYFGADALSAIRLPIL